MRNGYVKFSKRLGREDEKRDPGFHVEHAGPPQSTLGPLEGHALDRAYWPYRVEMAQAQHLRNLSATREVEFYPRVITVSAITAELDLGKRRDVIRYVFDRAIDCGLIIGRRLNADKIADPLDEFGQAGLDMAQDRVALRHVVPLLM